MPSPTTYIELMRSYLSAASDERSAPVLSAIPRVLLNWSVPASARVCARDVLLSACAVASPACIRDALLCPDGTDECVARIRTLFPDFPDNPSAFLESQHGLDAGDWRAALNQHWAICAEMDVCLSGREAVVAVIRSTALCMLHDIRGLNEVVDPGRFECRLDELMGARIHTISYLADLDIAPLALSAWNEGIFKRS